VSQSLGKNLIACVLSENNLSGFYKLKREWFVKDEVSVYEWVHRFVERYGHLPSLHFTRRRVEGFGAPDSPEPFGVWHDQYIERALYHRFDAMLPELQRRLGARDVLGALSQVTALVEDAHVLRADGGRDLLTAPDLAEAVLRELLEARTSAGMTGIPTGWPSLDRQTRGWQPGDLYVVLARPKMGKSTLLIHAAKAAHEAGFTPLFVSMEMRATQVGRRYLGMLTSMNAGAMRDGHISSSGEEVLRQAILSLRENPTPFYLVEGQFRKDINDLQSLIHELRPSIVLLDGGYLVKIAKLAKVAKWEQISEIAQSLKTIASTAGIPIITSFQFTRQVKSSDATKAGFEHIQLADAIGQLASVGIGLFDEVASAEYQGERRRRVEIVGGREGEEGGFFIHWDWDRHIFTEIVETQADPWQDQGEGEADGD